MPKSLRGEDASKNASFSSSIHTYTSAHSLAIQLKEYLKQFEPYGVVMEYAPPISSMSPALYCLDALYHFVLHDDIKQLYHPMTLATIVGKKARTKADSVVLGLSILKELQEQGWKVMQKRKPCHDCFEALIYVDYYLKNNPQEKKKTRKKKIKESKNE